MGRGDGDEGNPGVASRRRGGQRESDLRIHNPTSFEEQFLVEPETVVYNPNPLEEQRVKKPERIGLIKKR